MTLQNTAQALKLLHLAYPRGGINPDEETVALWHEMLADLPDELVIAAIKRQIALSPFTPTIAELRKNAVGAVQDAKGQLTGDAAWGIVQNAIRHYGYMQEGEALASMPPEVAQVVRRFGWQQLCMERVDSVGVQRGQFIKAFETAAANQREQLQIPQSLHDTVQALAHGMELPGPKAGSDES